METMEIRAPEPPTKDQEALVREILERVADKWTLLVPLWRLALGRGAFGRGPALAVRL